MTDFYSKQVADLFDVQESALYLGPAGNFEERVIPCRVLFTAGAESVMEAADRVLFAKVPTDMRVTDILFSSDGALAAGSQIKLGLGTVTGHSDFGTVVDDDLFDTSIAMETQVDRLDAYTTGTPTLEDVQRGQPLWEQAGVAADPGGDYWIYGTFLNDPPAIVESKVLLEIFFQARG